MAMKCLLKSNDTTKIIYYATMTKKKEIFILAANYLQSMDWKNDVEIFKAIVNFYTKARAMESLAYFYDSCAQMEMDQFGDYERALGFLKDGQACMLKATEASNHPEKLASFQTRVQIVEQFVQARSMKEENPRLMIDSLCDLLEQPEVEVCLQKLERIADHLSSRVECHPFGGCFRINYHSLSFDGRV